VKLIGARDAQWVHVMLNGKHFLFELEVISRAFSVNYWQQHLFKTHLSDYKVPSNIRPITRNELML